MYQHNNRIDGALYVHLGQRRLRRVAKQCDQACCIPTMAMSGAGAETCFNARRLDRIHLSPLRKQPYSSMSDGRLVHNSYWDMGASCNCRFCPTISSRISGITGQCQVVQFAFFFNCRVF